MEEEILFGKILFMLRQVIINIKYLFIVQER